MRPPRTPYEYVKGMSQLLRWGETLSPFGLSKEQAERIGLYMQCHCQILALAGILMEKRGDTGVPPADASRILASLKRAAKVCAEGTDSVKEEQQ